jgi:N-acetylmuramoyl-L-alanine amidase
MARALVDGRGVALLSPPRYVSGVLVVPPDLADLLRRSRPPAQGKDQQGWRARPEPGERPRAAHLPFPTTPSRLLPAGGPKERSPAPAGKLPLKGEAERGEDLDRSSDRRREWRRPASDETDDGKGRLKGDPCHRERREPRAEAKGKAEDAPGAHPAPRLRRAAYEAFPAGRQASAEESAPGDPGGDGVREPALEGCRGLVVIDPGHGGSNVGGRGPSGTDEKTVVLDLSKRVAEELRRRRVRVVLTRSSDRAVALEARAEAADRVGADALLSVHANWFRDPRVRGVETWVLDKWLRPSKRKCPRSQALAESVQKALVELTGERDRGVRQARYTVLVASKVPAALVEVGFLSNPATEKRLASREWRARIASAVAEAIVASGVLAPGSE